MVKVFGKRGRIERTLRVLKDLGAGNPGTAVLCEDDLMRRALHEHGVKSFSFFFFPFSCSFLNEEIASETELGAWRDGIRVKEQMLCQISKPFKVEGYDCPKCPLGVTADQYAFLAVILLLKDILVRNGFRSVILLLEERFYGRMPNTQQGFYQVIVSRDLAETMKAVWIHRTRYFRWLAYLPSIARHHVGLQNIVLHELPTDSRKDSRLGRSRRVLIVSTDSSEFKSYYSRPSAAIARACAQRGHQVLIATNLHGEEFSKYGFRARDLTLPFKQIVHFWQRILRLSPRAYSFADNRTTKINPELWTLTSALIRQSSRNITLRTAASILLLDVVFEQFRPDVLVVIPDHSHFGIAAVSIARKRGIHSLTALAGQMLDHPQYGFVNADVIAVNGTSARSILRKRGISSRRIVVTGMAHYDEIFRRAQAWAPAKTSKSKLVLFATENLPISETFKMISSVAEAVLQISGTRMLIRPHPRENPANYVDFVQRLGSERIALDCATPLYQILAMVDVCVTGFSNVAAEAMILDRPVVCMNLEDRPDMLEYIRDGAALGVRKPEDTAAVLHKVLFDENVRASLARRRRKFLRKHFYRTDGNASLRIVKLIEELTKNRPTTKPDRQF